MRHLIVLSLDVTIEREVGFKNEKKVIESLSKNNFKWGPNDSYQYIGATKFIVANLTQKIYFVRYDDLNLQPDAFIMCKSVEEFAQRVGGIYADPEEVYFVDNVFPYIFKGQIMNKEDDNYAIVSAIGVHYVKADKIFKTKYDVISYVLNSSEELMKKEINQEQAFAGTVADVIKKTLGSDADIDVKIVNLD